MGYFSNGTEGEMYEAKYCSRCIHEEDMGCPILAAHMLFNYDQKGDTEVVLDMLIPREGVTNKQCTMFVAREYKKDIKEYRLWSKKQKLMKELAELENE